MGRETKRGRNKGSKENGKEEEVRKLKIYKKGQGREDRR